jgi:hypothetical protein
LLDSANCFVELVLNEPPLFAGVQADQEGKAPDGQVSPSKIPTVPVSDNCKETNEGSCPVCHEEFDQIFKEDGSDDDGRWHYHNAIRPEEGEEDTIVYHPQCYQDRLTSASEGMEEESFANAVSTEESPGSVKPELDQEMKEETKEETKEAVEETKEAVETSGNEDPEEKMEVEQCDEGKCSKCDFFLTSELDTNVTYFS